MIATKGIIEMILNEYNFGLNILGIWFKGVRELYLFIMDHWFWSDTFFFLGLLALFGIFSSTLASFVVKQCPYRKILQVANFKSQSSVLSEKEAIYLFANNRQILEQIRQIKQGNLFYKYGRLCYMQFCLVIVKHNVIKCYLTEYWFFFLYLMHMLVGRMLCVCIWYVNIWICIGLQVHNVCRW